MCGIYGYAKLDPKAQGMSLTQLRVAMNFLACANESRGDDSTGIAHLNYKGGTRLLKRVGAPTDFIQDEAIIKFFRNQELAKFTKAILGHTRQATTGDVNLNNAMPFTWKHVIGTHNGMITNYQDLWIKEDLAPKTTCDSEIIFALMSKTTDTSERVELLGDLSGYFVISFYDTRQPDRIYFAKDFGDLSLWKDPKKGYLLWSSEEKDIKILSTLLDLQLEEIEVNYNELIYVERNGSVVKADIPVTSTKSTTADYSYNYNTRHFCHPDQFKDSSLIYTTCKMCNERKATRWNSSYGGYTCKLCRKRFKKEREDSFDQSIKDLSIKHLNKDRKSRWVQCEMCGIDTIQKDDTDILCEVCRAEVNSIHKQEDYDDDTI